VGRLPAVTGGGPTAPEMEQAGKATGPRLLGQPGCRSRRNFAKPVAYILATGFLLMGRINLKGEKVE